MNANEKEAYVRERWVEVQVNTGYEGDFFVVNLADSYAFNTWQAAYDFTLQREKEIAEKREQIRWLRSHLRTLYTVEQEAMAKGIFDILEAQLAELQKGMNG